LPVLAAIPVPLRLPSTPEAVAARFCFADVSFAAGLPAVFVG
jgi:hypothetical protein